MIKGILELCASNLAMMSFRLAQRFGIGVVGEIIGADEPDDAGWDQVPEVLVQTISTPAVVSPMMPRLATLSREIAAQNRRPIFA